ncbi:MAG: hypothetical protein SO057_01505, partial [Atopobiaceae bacterium]|nr:hypothetical protein [Atopobiaceae bacterium]
MSDTIMPNQNHESMITMRKSRDERIVSLRWIEFVSATLQSEAQRLQQVLQNVPEALRQGVQFGLPEHPGRRMACI